MNVVIAEARMPPLLNYLRSSKVWKIRAYLVIIRFQKDELHVWGKLPVTPINQPTILLQRDSAEMCVKRSDNLRL